MSVPQVPLVSVTYASGRNVWKEVPQVPHLPGWQSIGGVHHGFSRLTSQPQRWAQDRHLARLPSTVLERTGRNAGNGYDYV